MTMTNIGNSEELSGKRSLPDREIAGSIPTAGIFSSWKMVSPEQIYEYI